MNKYRTAPEDSSFYFSEIKQKKRELILSLLSSMSSSKVVLTLGGLYAKDAKMFAAQGARVLSVEMDKDTFVKQKNELIHYPNVTPLFGKLENVIEQDFIHTFSFNLVYLDYLGPYNKSKEDTIIALFNKNLIAKDGYICLTVMLAREDKKNFKDTILLNVTCQDDINLYFENREDILAQTLRDIARASGKRLKTISIGRYRNNEIDLNISSATPPMFLCIMKVIS